MIINKERDPALSLYYLGAVIIEILSENPNFLLDDLYDKVKEKINQNLSLIHIFWTGKDRHDAICR